MCKNNILALILILLSIGNVFSQEKKNAIQIIYNLKYLDDTTKTNFVQENAELTIVGEQSYFITIQKSILDSIEYFGMPQSNYRRFKSKGLRVYKDLSKKLIAQYEEFLPKNYLFSEENLSDLVWNIREDTLSIHSYLCQKATINYGGRSWTAWFTSEIPISDGPYKFSGLPGLIIQMYDSKRHWNIDFAQLLYKDTKRIDLPFKDAIKKDKVKIFKDKREYSLNSLQKLEAAGILSFDIKDRAQLFEENRKKAERDNNWIEMYP
ncbi:GLPGLI family protein [Sphingobacterium siyangense]|uniref:GLPGLI family protein n=1 Tax=Sphingobacterium siyangense TaxID=459529 RepID=UPI002FDDFDE9